MPEDITPHRPDSDKNCDPGSKSEGEEDSQSKGKATLGRTPNHLSLSTTSTLSAGSTGSQARLIQSSHQPENYQPTAVKDLGKPTCMQCYLSGNYKTEWTRPPAPNRFQRPLQGSSTVAQQRGRCFKCLWGRMYVVGTSNKITSLRVCQPSSSSHICDRVFQWSCINIIIPLELKLRSSVSCGAQLHQQDKIWC